MKCTAISIVGFAALAHLSGCGGTPRAVDWPEARMLGRDLPAYRPPHDPALERESSAPEEPTGDLSLRQAFAASLLRNPTLAAFGWEVRVREARALQASLPPNPEAELEVEEFGGTGGTSGFDGAETTLLFSQLVELGSKRQRRTRVAELDQDLAAWDFETARVAVLSETASAFIETLSLQERLALARKNLDLAVDALDAIGKRVRAGAASGLDEDRAGVVVAKARIDVRRIERGLNAAKVRLAASWGGRQVRFDRVVGEFGQTRPLPSLQAITRLVAQNPEVARWGVEIVQRQAQLDLARSKAVPDVNVGVGVKHLAEPDDTAAVVRFSLPLPLFDRNQGGILESRYELAKAREAQRAAELRVETAIGQAWQRLAAAHETATALQSDVLPAAQKTYEATRTAFTEGKIGYLDVLDAQRTLFESHDQLVEALASYHAAVVEVEALTGRPLSAVDREPPVTDPDSNNPINPGANP